MQLAASPSTAARGAACVAFALLVSCGSDPVGPGGVGAPPPSPPAPTGAVTATVQPSGGSLSATADNGATITLTFPAGAVRFPTQVTIRPLPPSGGRWMEAALEPAGLVFRRPFTVTVVLPSQVALERPTLMLRPGDAPVPLATTVNTGTRTLTTNALSFLGFAPHAEQVPLARRVGPLASNHGGGNTLAAGMMSCQDIVAVGQVALDGYIALGEPRYAIESVLSTGELLQESGCSEAVTWLAQAEQVACDQLGIALATMTGSSITAFGQFESEAGLVLGWFGMVQRLAAAACAATDNVQDALENEVEDFFQFFTPRINALSTPSWPTFQDLKDEAIRVRSLQGLAYQLSLPDQGDALGERAFDPTLDVMRSVAFSLCRADGWHYPLSRLTPTGFFAARDIVGVSEPRPGPIWPAPGQYTGFTEDDIHDDLQYCGTELTLSGLVSSGGTHRSTPLGTQGAPGLRTKEVALETPTRGKLRLSGGLFAMTCWNGVEADQEIALLLNGRRVHTLQRSAQGRYLDGAVELDIADLAEAAGITPKEGTPHDLVLRRSGSECDPRLWGPAEFELLRATLEWRNPTLEVEVTIPDVVTPGTEVDADVRVKVIDLLGEAGFFDAIDVVLDVEGGTAREAAGRTDAQGYFRTKIQVPAMRVIGASVASAPLSVTARATSFEGVTATATRAVQGDVCAPPQHLLDDRRFFADTSFFFNGATGVTYSIDRSEFNDILVRVNAAPPGSLPIQGAIVRVNWRDHISIVPDDPSRASDHFELEYHVKADGAVTGTSGNRTATVRAGDATFLPGVRLDAALNLPPTEFAMDSIARVPVRAGTWIEVVGGAYASAGASGGVRATAQSAYSFSILRLIDANGLAVPHRICSAWGWNY